MTQSTTHPPHAGRRERRSATLQPHDSQPSPNSHAARRGSAGDSKQALSLSKETLL